MKDEIIINETATPTEAEANSASATSANGANASADAKAAATVTINVVNGNDGEKATPVVIPSAQDASGEASYDRTGYADADPATAGKEKKMESNNNATPWWGKLLWGIVILAALFAVLLFLFEGCNGDGEFRLLGTVQAGTDSEPTETSDEVLWLRGLNERLIEALAAKGISVNIDNNDQINIDFDQWVSQEQYQLLLKDCKELKIELSSVKDENRNLKTENDALHATWDGHTCECHHGDTDDHVCDHSACNKALEAKDQEISKVKEDRDYWKKLYQNHTCPTTTSTSSSHVCDHTQCRADLDWAKEQWAADVEERDEEIADLKQENSNLRKKNSDLEEKNTNLTKENKKLQNEIENYVCPCCGCEFNCTCGGSCHPSGGCDGSCDCGGSFGGTWGNGNHNPSGSNGSTTGGSTGGSSTGNSNGVIWAEDPDEYAQTGEPDGDGAHNDSPRGRGNN